MGSAEEQQLIQKIREEIAKKGIHLNKFLEVVESFADDIPSEAKRYGAALKAMSHAAGLKKEDILNSVDEQIAELKNQRTVMATSVAERRVLLKQKTQKAQELRNQINLLKESVKRIEEEEKEYLISVATGETEIKSIETRLDSVIKQVEQELLDIKDRINSNLSKPAAAEAAPPPAPKAKPEPERPSKRVLAKKIVEEEEEEEEISEEEEEAAEEEIMETVFEKEDDKEKEEADLEGGIQSPIGGKPSKSSKKDTKQKPCPVCSNPMDWYSFDNHWKCFVCGHEE